MGSGSHPTTYELIDDERTTTLFILQEVILLKYSIATRHINQFRKIRECVDKKLVGSFHKVSRNADKVASFFFFFF